MIGVAIGFGLLAIFQMVVAVNPRLKRRFKWGDSTTGPEMSRLSHFLIALFWLGIAVINGLGFFKIALSQQITIFGSISLFVLIIASGLWDAWHGPRQKK